MTLKERKKRFERKETDRRFPTSFPYENTLFGGEVADFDRGPVIRLPANEISSVGVYKGNRCQSFVTWIVPKNTEPYCRYMIL